MNLRLTIPDPSDELVLATDASKIAASAIFFRVRDGKLELVACNSKYFSVTDLTKCSYVLEAIALRCGLKTYASYLLNCESQIRIFTDAKSLIYAKRNSAHSILLNGTLNYLANFASMVNEEIYHVPGDVNVLADLMFRAKDITLTNNINCNLPKEHPISKKWAELLPPIKDHFNVDRETLFKFLTDPLKPEDQDPYNRTHRKLMEPKSVHTWYRTI
jgi:hypothetical protein